MKPIEPYLFFNGNCKEAMSFYESCFGGDSTVMTLADAPEKCEGSSEMDENLVMHACLRSGDLVLMASDMAGGCGDGEFVAGQNIQLNLNVDTYEEQDALIAKLKDGGKLIHGPEETFWQSRFAIVGDPFGITWMLNCPLK